MGQIYRTCDRCGNLIEVNPLTYNRARMPRLSTTKFMARIDYEEYDFCDKCMMDFNKMFKEYMHDRA